MTIPSRPSRSGRTLVELGAVNHQSFFAAAAEAAGGTVLRRHDGVVAVVRGDAAHVLFAAVPGADIVEFVDEMLALLAQHRPVTEIGWWSLDSAGIPSLGAALRDRGFGWGWQPNWMALDIAELVTDLPRPAGLA